MKGMISSKFKDEIERINKRKFNRCYWIQCKSHSVVKPTLADASTRLVWRAIDEIEEEEEEEYEQEEDKENRGRI